MEIFLSLIIGILGGFTAGKMISSGGLGLKGNLPVGIIAALIGGLFARYFGVNPGKELLIATCATAILSVVFFFSIVNILQVISRKIKG